MNIQDFKNKFKNIVDIAVDFVINNKRYFLAGCIFVVMALVLFIGTDPNAASDKSTSGVYKDYKSNKSTSLETLIKDYYTAYSSGDTDTIATLATPLSDQEISYIQFYSQYIDSFDDIKIYTKEGLTENSYLVSTEVSLKFKDIATAAPGLDFFYVETNEEGNLYINNIYGSFNQNNNVYELDPEVSDLISVFTRQQDLLDMEAEVDEAYTKALADDADLNLFMSETLPAAIVQWNSDYQAQVAQAEAEAAAQAEEEAKAAEEAAAAAEEEAKAAEEAANSYSGTTNARANVREEADSSSNKLGSLESGVAVTIYGEEGDFYKFDYNGTKAYITKDAITLDSEEDTDTAEEEEETTSTASLAEGTEITLDSTVNIRSQMDSSSSKVAVAYAGEEVTVVMSYAEGWTKVKYGKKEGYIRTDLLEQ